MTTVFRLLRRPFSANPFDGEGSYLYGGRWSSAGTRIVYTSEHLSLAMLEYLAHVDPASPPRGLVLARAEVPEDLSRTEVKEADLPGGWRNYPAPDVLCSFGDSFIRKGMAAVLIVPSAPVPGERNWLLNPADPEFRRIRLLDTEAFDYDPRLLR